MVLAPCKFKSVLILSSLLLKPSGHDSASLLATSLVHPKNLEKHKISLLMGKRNQEKALSIPIHNIVPGEYIWFFSIRVSKVPLNALAMPSKVIKGFSK